MNMMWEVFDYERDMAIKLSQMLIAPQFETLPWEFRNAVVESLVIHTRVLTEIVLSEGTRPDDITLKKLLPAFESENIQALKASYDDDSSGISPRWQFNKLLAHATTLRIGSHEYAPAINQVWTCLSKLIVEIEAARNTNY
jgi:hypothetical protein